MPLIQILLFCFYGSLVLRYAVGLRQAVRSQAKGQLIIEKALAVIGYGALFVSQLIITACRVPVGFIHRAEGLSLLIMVLALGTSGMLWLLRLRPVKKSVVLTPTFQDSEVGPPPPAV
jgi:hypothetical protein